MMISSEQFKAASLIVKLGNAVTYYRNLKMENIDLTSVQSDAIITMFRNPGITAAQLKDHLQLSQSTVAGIIARLENKGLVKKTVDQHDARKTILKPTAHGELLEEPLKEIALETHQLIVAGMTEREQEEFMRLLQIALDNMSQIRSEFQTGGKRHD
jgi:DNA-binding MarR family transcriptional regulator